MNPGGCFFNVDNMRPRDDVLRERYAEIRDPEAAARRRAARAAGQPGGGGREHSDPVADQLAWLRAAGYQHVDCFYKKLDRAMIGGYK